MNEATICKGILGTDGIVRGRIADVELFQMFNVDMCEARDFETGEYLLDEATRKRLAKGPNGGDLWRVTKRKTLTGDKGHDTPEAKAQRLASLELRHATGLPLFDEEGDDE